jgi:hypothetical protein
MFVLACFVLSCRVLCLYCCRYCRPLVNRNDERGDIRSSLFCCCSSSSRLYPSFSFPCSPDAFPIDAITPVPRECAMARITVISLPIPDASACTSSLKGSAPAVSAAKRFYLIRSAFPTSDSGKNVVILGVMQSSSHKVIKCSSGDGLAIGCLASWAADRENFIRSPIIRCAD